MASIKDLKRRITTTKSTQQTTKAMKLVSAAKLRRAQDAIQTQRPFARGIQSLIKNLSQLVGDEFDSPFFKRGSTDESTTGPRVLIVLVTSDRGLCGGFNANVIKATQRWMAANASKYSSMTLSFVGRKGNESFKSKKVVIDRYLSEISGKPTFGHAKIFGKYLTDAYLSGQFDEVKVVFNEFKNAVTQKVVVEDFLPIDINAADSVDGPATTLVAGEEPVSVANILVKPNPTEVLTELLSKYFAIQAFRILLESQASEHGARMAAMENATKNAGEMIKGLTLQYNKQRQAGITKELLEIIAGSESQKAS